MRAATSAPSPGVDDAPAIISASTDMYPASRSSSKTDCGGLDQIGETVGVLDRGLVARQAQRAHLVERGEEQVRHRAEVVEDEALVAPGTPRDLARRRPRESLLTQGLDGARDQRPSGLLGTRRATLSGPTLHSRPCHCPPSPAGELSN